MDGKTFILHQNGSSGTLITCDLPKGSVFSRGQLPKLKRFVQFVVFCYVPWWLTSPIASAAPNHDLCLINNVILYDAVDSVISNAALKAFRNHLWYLTEELVCLALFSSSVDNSIKQKMVAKLLSFPFTTLCKSREGNGFGKPRFPALPDEPEHVDLSDFIGEDSWSFFKILCIREGFLQLPVSQWSSNSDWLRGKSIVDALHVAERGIKLCQDFLGTARTEGRFQEILQVVENARHSVPNQRRRKVASNSWYLVL